MAHPENKSIVSLLMEQQEGIMRESIRMAERLLSEGASKMSWESREAKERYLSAVPYVALSIKEVFGQLTGMTEQASKAQLDRIYDSCQEVLNEAKRRNDAATKEGA